MATTPNYSFSVYGSTDTDVRFLDFRVATAGSQSTSNFYVIDTVLKQHSDAIDSINATPSAFVVKGTYSAGSLYTASVANYPGYKNEQLIVLSLNQKNTGAVQININGTTNKDVMKYGSDGVLKAVDAGDFVANSPVLCLYDGTQFVVIGITSASSITVTGEAGDILQIADDGTIESSGKKAAQPNGIATLDENGNVVQVANMANSAAAVYSGEPVTVEYAGAQRIASITAYGETPQGGTTEAPVALTGVDSVLLGGNNLLPKATETKTLNGVTFTPNPDGSVSVSGTATNNAAYVFANGLDDSLFGQTVCLSGGSMQTQLIINEKKPSGEWLRNVITNAKTPTAVGVLSKQVDDNILYGTIYVPTGTTVNTTIYPMLNLGNTAMPYEPYQGSVTPLPIPRPLRRVGDVKDKCVTRQDYESAEKLVVTYNVGFVELDGTEAWQASSQTSGMFFITRDNISAAAAICSNFNFSKSATTEQGKFYIVSNQIRFLTSYETLESWKNYLAAQKAEGTPVQIAYQLATPEVYATDPVDFDNTAGPLTVVTGGQVEVKMTDFVTDRTPAFLNKLDKTGDGSDVTVTFTEAATDTDIASGDKLSILFGKILKRFTNILNGTTKVGYATKADTDNLGNQITETYANSLDVADNTIVLKNKIGENLSTITVPYANSAGNVATSIKEMGIAVQTASPYAWFLNYTGSGNKDGARKYYASVYADNATYSTSAGSSNNIVIYNNNWSGTDGSISAIYANAEKTYVNLSSSNAAGTAWPNISVQRINGHALNMALNGTSLSITW